MSNTSSQKHKNENLNFIRSIQNLQYITERVDDFISIVGPSNAAQLTRQNLFQELANAITKELPNAIILPYGSFQSNCYLFNSDIDFCCWNKEEDQKTTASRVLKALSSLNLQNLEHINADVSVIKFTYGDIGFDISFTQPAGVLTAYFLELLNNYIGKNHLLKRSLVFIQCYCMNELHILGSHNFMLSSYGLRTLVIYILLHQTELSTPLQTLYAFLAYFSSFDFDMNLISIFGAVPKSDFEKCTTAHDFVDLQVSQFVQKNFINKELQLVKQIQHLIALRVASDSTVLEQKGLKNCLKFYQFGQPSEQQLSPECQKFFTYLDDKISSSSDATLNQALDDFVRSALLIQFFRDQKSPFQFTSVNIADPLLPSNNIGKTVSEANMKRMKRVFQLGYFNIQKLMKMTLDGNNTVAECVAEFDMNFAHTLSICQLAKLARQVDLDFDALQSNGSELQSLSISVVFQGLGFRQGEERDVKEKVEEVVIEVVTSPKSVVEVGEMRGEEIKEAEVELEDVKIEIEKEKENLVETEDEVEPEVEVIPQKKTKVEKTNEKGIEKDNIAFLDFQFKELKVNLRGGKK